MKPHAPSDTLDIFLEPTNRRSNPRLSRPRRNSESSVTEKKPLSPEEERKRRERKHGSREHRSKDSKGRPIPPPSSGKIPNRRLDVIDKLDVTSIFGTGGKRRVALEREETKVLTVFHHDGPFDACNPARNRKGSSRAPMAAFPKDSANNVLGGSGPLKKNIDIEQFHGRLPDSFGDFAAPAGRKNSSNQMEQFVGYSRGPVPNAKRESVLNTNANIEPVHGDESLGLGTSTFLEGAPAARVTIQRRESEAEEYSGLSRKKSLVQKIRGVSNSRSMRNHELGSPAARWEQNISPDPTQTQSTGNLTKITEQNPFFQDYDAEYEKKGASVRMAEEQRQEVDSSRVVRDDLKPMGDDLHRTVTETSTTGADEGKSGGGFLNRVKSLRSKKRPERKE